LLRERGTRAAVISVLQDLTGPARRWCSSRCARRTPAPGALPAATAPLAGGQPAAAVPMLRHGLPRPGLRHCRGGRLAQRCWWLGGGAIEYASLAMLQGQITDADIDAAIAGVMPVAAIAWTRISD